MKTSDVATFVTIGDTSVPVLLGDTVWYFPGNDLAGGPPQVATVVMLCEQNMVHLAYVPAGTTAVTRREGVCLVGDPRLENEAVRKRGSWIPRGNWPVLNLKD
jgi:hypothetical protein